MKLPTQIERLVLLLWKITTELLKIAKQELDWTLILEGSIKDFSKFTSAWETFQMQLLL